MKSLLEGNRFLDDLVANDPDFERQNMINTFCSYHGIAPMGAAQKYHDELWAYIVMREVNLYPIPSFNVRVDDD